MLRLTVVAAVALFTTSVAAEEIDSKAIIQEALSAAPPEIAANAAVEIHSLHDEKKVQR